MNNTWVNGEATKMISVHDRGFQFGDGLFETMRIVDGCAKDLTLHLKRMKAGAKRLSICFPVGWEEEIQTACKTKTNGVCKLMLTRGASGAGLRLPTTQQPTRIIKIMALPKPLAALQKTGAKLQLCNTVLSCNPATAGLKMLNWLEPALAHLELREGCHEGLMADATGNIIEGTSSNFFALKEDLLLTPDLSHCGLKGITRDQVMQAAETLGLKVVEKNIVPSALASFDACFMSNSVVGIYPVAAIRHQEKTYHYEISPVFEKLKNTGLFVSL